LLRRPFLNANRWWPIGLNVICLLRAAGGHEQSHHCAGGRLAEDKLLSFHIWRQPKSEVFGT